MAQPASNPPAAARPTAKATRIEPTEAPTIDADLSDPVWAKATVLEDFHQQEPDTGAPATERTVLRILYDENNFYFGVYAYDAHPEEITVRSMARDGPLFTGDNVTFVLDPGITRRNAYRFQVGAAGGRVDQLILNNNSNLNQWNAIWQGKAKVVADGWIAEIAIPFRSLSYRGDQPDWGFEFSRNIRHKNESVNWAMLNPALSFVDISEEGTLTGITNINAGVGLDVQVYGALRAKHDWHIAGDGAGIRGTGGANAFYKITPALTGTLTLNPDFSNAPLDAREINTTRFSLFTPETREFFLQDVAAFEFGGRVFAHGFDRTFNNARPFFSRNIGLVKGLPVSIVGGGKLSGEYEGFGIGALSVRTADTATSRGQTLSVARVTRSVFGESTIGAIFTNGDPTGATDNTLAGTDFQYRNADFYGSGKTVQADFSYERSFSDVFGDDHTAGVALNFPNEPWFGDATFKEVGTNFKPALGFVNRAGIRFYDGTLGYRLRYRNQFLRTLEFSTTHQFVTDLKDKLETRKDTATVDVLTNATDELAVTVGNFHENVPQLFRLPNDIPVPAGSYGWTNLELHFNSSSRRTIDFEIDAICCRLYDGNSVVVKNIANFRPNAYFEIGVEYDLTHLDMPTGEGDVHVVAVNSAVNFSPDMTLAIQLQYDSVSKNLGFLARYRWEFTPVDEFFVAFGQSAFVPGRFVAQRSQFSIHLGHTVRF